MPKSLTIGVCGLRWRLDMSALYPGREDLADEIGRLWSRAVVEPDGSELPFVVVLSGEEVPVDERGLVRGAAVADDAAFPYTLSRALTVASISARIGTALMLHAAGLASPDGERALVLVAPAGTGKSTAVRRLGHRFGYLSDETVVIEADLTVSPYPKPISVVSKRRPGDKDEHAPDELGLTPTPHRPTVAAVVVMRRSAAAERPVLEPVGLIDGMLDVLPETSAVHRLAGPLQWLARAMVRGGGPYSLRFSDIADCEDLLAGLLDRDPGGADLAWVSHSPGQQAANPAFDAEAPALVRAGWTDAIEHGGEVLVLLERRPLRLSGIGATVWLAADRPVTEQRLAGIAVAEHGPHPDAQYLVRAAIRDLVAAGALREARSLPELPSRERDLAGR